MISSALTANIVNEMKDYERSLIVSYGPSVYVSKTRLC